VTRTAMASVRSTSIRLRVSGRFCAPGCGPIGASHRSTCPCTWAFSSSCTMPAFGANTSCPPCLACWSLKPPKPALSR
jgi:hypothetical protein